MGAWDAAFPLAEDDSARASAGRVAGRSRLPTLPGRRPSRGAARARQLGAGAGRPGPHAAGRWTEQLADLSEELEIDEDLPGRPAHARPRPRRPRRRSPERRGRRRGHCRGRPGSEPQAPMPRAQESSNVLIIPDVAGAGGGGHRRSPAPRRHAGHAGARAERHGRRPSGRRPGRPGAAGRRRAARRVGAVAADAGARGRGRDRRAGRSTTNCPTRRPSICGWSCRRCPGCGRRPAWPRRWRRVSATGAPPEDDYWKAQLALAVDESAVLQRDQQASPRARAQALLWAARAAERVGRGDALRLYEQALALDPSLPEANAALRGQFRLLYAAGAGRRGARTSWRRWSRRHHRKRRPTGRCWRWPARPRCWRPGPPPPRAATTS